MYLKALEIHGFKSFPDRTKLTFTNGLTAVVGPNGSGKSNISDAVRWVLGEQSTKTLRGERMEDVIFGGTQTRRAMGFAQVTLYIDHSDGGMPMDSPEVTVTRKLYRSGESEYKINNQNVRLRDVHELFMDTGLGRDGYSIIGQGRIAEIVGAKSGNRREIFEEAAGIAKFRMRKTEAERKLLAAQENLLRLRDILVELEDRVGPLQQQAQKASAFVALAADKKRLELSIWVNQLTQMRDNLHRQEEHVAQCQAAHTQVEDELTAVEAAAEQARGEVSRCTMEIDQLRIAIREREEQAAQARSQVAVWENDMFHNQSSTQRITGELEAQTATGQALEAQIAARMQEMSSADEQTQQLQEQREQMAEQTAALTQSERTHAEGLERGRQGISALALRLSEAKMAVAAYQAQYQETVTRGNALKSSHADQLERLQTLTKDRQECEDLLESIAENLQSLQHASNGVAMKLRNKEERQAGLEHDLRALELRAKEKRQRAAILEGLEQNMEGYAGSVKHVLRQAKRGVLQGVHSAISKLIEVDEQYLTAIEVALGGALQHIVVEDDQSAKRAIACLKQEKAGRATFLPLSTIKGSRLPEDGCKGKPGYLGVASDLVRCKPVYRSVVESLLGRVAVAEDLDCAVRLAHATGHRFRIVTLDGQLVHVGGSMTGGSVAKSAGILSRQIEIDRLKTQADELSQQMDTIAATHKEVADEIAALQAQGLAVESERKSATEDRIRYESEQKRIVLLLDDLTRSREDAAQQLARLDARLEELQTAVRQAQAQAEEAAQKQAQAEQDVAAYAEQYAAVQKQREDLAARRAQLDLDLLSHAKDVEAVQHSLAALTTQRAGQSERIEEFRAQLANLEQKNEEIAADIAQTQAHIVQMGEETNQAQQEIVRLQRVREQSEQRATAIRVQEKDAAARKELLARDLARVEERKLALQGEYDAVIAHMWDEYEITRSEAQSLAEPLDDLAQAQRKLAEVKAHIKALGTVNLAAIDEYEQVSGRYNFLKAQVEDAEHSRDQLGILIQELTAQMRELFLASFQQINQNFGRVFAELFEGGQASLTLTESDDVLEAGVDIHVQPPGKLIKNLASLSGGEQAFVAIAIYFAILQVRPAPFCLLDEIEAALDDVNVTKFAQYLQRLGEKTQFIAITHRRGTMEEADVLYGVTMQEEGVSKLLELSVSELESKLGMK